MVICYTNDIYMNQGDILKAYYKSVKGAPIAELKEAEEIVLA
jgi:hypothetical protein